MVIAWLCTLAQFQKSDLVIQGDISYRMYDMWLHYGLQNFYAYCPLRCHMALSQVLHKHFLDLYKPREAQWYRNFAHCVYSRGYNTAGDHRRQKAAKWDRHERERQRRATDLEDMLHRTPRMTHPHQHPHQCFL